MPDRPRNRPRIAGQRRTGVGPATEETTEELLDEPGDAVVEESGDEPLEAVTQDTAGAEDTPADESETPPSATESSEKGPVGGVLFALLGVLIVLVLTVAAVLGVKAWQGKQAEDARNQAAAAGRKAAETALSYDYRDLDKSFAAARATMTPEFAGKFDETAKVAGELATKSKATVKAEVREVGVRDGDADRVTLIIFVNQTTTSTITQGKPRVDLNRTRFTMVRKDGRWLVQEIAGL
jgi:Mce-associated membrane protein